MVFPAHAGMNRPDKRAAFRGDRVPRTRGDEPWDDGTIGRPVMCSPHTRGWNGCLDLSDPRPGVFPAHAGMELTGGLPV